MSDTNLSDTVGADDPGDVVLQRFDYQFTYSAILAVGLLGKS